MDVTVKHSRISRQIPKRPIFHHLIWSTIQKLMQYLGPGISRSQSTRNSVYISFRVVYFHWKLPRIFYLFGQQVVTFKDFNRLLP